MNPLDTRCSWVPVHTSQPSLLFLWASVLWRTQKMVLSHQVLLQGGHLPESPTEGRKGQDGDPKRLAGDREDCITTGWTPASPWLRKALHPEGHPVTKLGLSLPPPKGTVGLSCHSDGARPAAHPCPCRFLDWEALSCRSPTPASGDPCALSEPHFSHL